MAVEAAAWRVARRCFGQLAARRGAIAAAIKDLSTHYNSSRSRIGPAPDEPTHRLARLVFFTVADLPKVAYPIAELAARSASWPPRIPAGAALAERCLRVLDLGAGCGTLSLGLMGQLEALGFGGALEIDAMDTNGAMLELFAELLAECRRERVFGATGERSTVRFRTGSATLWPATRAAEPIGERFDLVLAGSVLNELAVEQRLPLLRALLEHLDPDGSILLLEPALRRTTRALHELRDSLLAQELATAFAPCTHSGPCPALLRPSDWCHERRRWPAEPPELRRLSASSGLHRRDLRWSYTTLRRDGANVAGQRPQAWRVVSEPLPSKGKTEIYLCGPPGRMRARRLDRHRSDDNSAFDRLGRGCLVWLEQTRQAAGDCLVLDRSSRVETADPAGEVAP